MTNNKVKGLEKERALNITKCGVGDMTRKTVCFSNKINPNKLKLNFPLLNLQESRDNVDQATFI